MIARRLLAVLLAPLVGTLVGCVGAPPAPEGENAAALSNATAFANDKAAYDFFVGKGLTNFQSAGIVGNLDQESGVDPTSVQYGGGPGRGIAQWSVGGRWDTSANDNVQWYASKQGASATSLNLQLEFIWYELTNIGYGYSALKATTNVTDATLAFMKDYEICGTCASSQRIAYAQSVLSAYGATPDWSASFVSQSWPYASQPAFKIKCGQTLAANIVLKNDGGKTWNSSTRLGTTGPRDRASIFAASDWVAPNRAAAIKGTVAPGANGTFTFSFHGPTGTACVPGTYKEFFGVVQESVAWFSDNGQGGPPDNQLEALIQLEPGDPTPPTDDMGGGNGNGGGDGGTSAGGDDGGTSAGGDDGGLGSDGNGGGPGDPPAPKGFVAHNGCSVAFGGSDGGAGAGVLLLLGCLVLFRLRQGRGRKKSSELTSAI